MSKKIMSWFFEGVLVMVPVLITCYIMYLCITFVSNLLMLAFGFYLSQGIPELNASWQPALLSLILVFLLVTFVGAFTQFWLGRHLLNFVDRTIERTPLVKLLYAGLRDGMKTLFVERKKFERPVMVKFSNVYIPGFITGENMVSFGLDNYVAVYLPLAFSASGRVVLVSRDDIQYIDQKPGAIMSFLISAGLSSNQLKNR